VKDQVFQSRKSREADFDFNPEVADVFEDMLERSVPYYHEVKSMTASLIRYYYEQEAGTDKKIIYDLGSSTGALAYTLSQKFQGTPFYYTGIDNSPAMVEKAVDIFSRNPGRPEHQIKFLCDDILSFHYENPFVFVSNYTIQFLRPMERLPFLRKLYQSLAPGGVFLMSEKVLENNSGYSRAFQKLYYDFKKENGYSEMEIAGKREALENVLIPYRTDENIQMLSEAGFDYIDLYFKWFNFASFIAIKKP